MCRGWGRMSVGASMWAHYAIWSKAGSGAAAPQLLRLLVAADLAAVVQNGEKSYRQALHHPAAA